MSVVTLAAAQFSCTWDRQANIAKAKDMVRRAASQGANVVVLPELFETPYFCQDQSAEHSYWNSVLIRSLATAVIDFSR